jgi:hypothetical protein
VEGEDLFFISEFEEAHRASPAESFESWVVQIELVTEDGRQKIFKSPASDAWLNFVHGYWLRIPGHADQYSGVMSITIPGSCRSSFRDDGDQDSGLMPIKSGRSRNVDRHPRNRILKPS